MPSGKARPWADLAALSADRAPSPSQAAPAAGNVDVDMSPEENLNANSEFAALSDTQLRQNITRIDQMLAIAHQMPAGVVSPLRVRKDALHVQLVGRKCSGQQLDIAQKAHRKASEAAVAADKALQEHLAKTRLLEVALDKARAAEKLAQEQLDA
eukprot:2837384-Amphidinium_carterae.1